MDGADAGAEAVVDAVDALSSIMQVNMSKKTYMTFQEELDYLNKYICMKEFQKAARIKFVCKIEEELRQVLYPENADTADCGKFPEARRVMRIRTVISPFPFMRTAGMW